MLIQGLTSIKSENGQYMAETTTLDTALFSAESEVSSTQSVFQSQVPVVVKKIKGLPIV